MKYDIVLWDFDGTLANTGQDVWGSLEYAARVLGGEIRKQFRAEIWENPWKRFFWR